MNIYRVKDVNDEALKRMNDEKAKHKDKAFELFRQCDYENAVIEFEKALGLPNANDTINYYINLSRMKAGNLNAAAMGFRWICEIPTNHPFYDSAFYYFLKCLPYEVASYEIRQIGIIPESLQLMSPEHYLCASDFDDDGKLDLFFGGRGITVYLSSGRILLPSQYNFTPFWVEPQNGRIEVIATMNYDLYHILLSERDGKLVVVDTARMIGLPKLFASRYGVKSVSRFGDDKSSPLIIVDNGPGPPKPNKSFIVKTPEGDISEEIDLNVEASSFALSVKLGSFYIGTFMRPKEMNEGFLPIVVRFNTDTNKIVAETIFVYPYDPPFRDDFFYGAGYVGMVETDLECDGMKDLLLQESHIGEDSEHQYILRVISEGSDKWFERWNGAFYFRGKRTLAADVNGDGIKEIFTDNNTGYSKDCIPHILVISNDSNNWTTKKMLVVNGYLLDSGDFDGDGSEEVVILKCVSPDWFHPQESRPKRNHELWLIDREN